MNASDQAWQAVPGAVARLHSVAAFEPWCDNAGVAPPQASVPLPARWFALMLEEVGHGVLLLGASGRVLHANHQARAELGSEHPLRLSGAELQARGSRDQSALQAALVAARRGLRRLLMLGDGRSRASVVFVPLESMPGQCLTLVLLGLRRLGHPLTLQGFARSHALTAAETRVLEHLCAGTKPGDIAAAHGVSIATVRTQIASIRQKTGAADINALVMLVALLPPMVSVLRPDAVPVQSEDSVRYCA